MAKPVVNTEAKGRSSGNGLLRIGRFTSAETEVYYYFCEPDAEEVQEDGR